MRTKLSFVFAVSIAWGFLSPVARAQLVLNVNPATKTLWFTGSDSGTTASGGSVSWQQNYPSSNANFNFTTGATGLLTTVVGYSGATFAVDQNTGTFFQVSMFGGAGSTFDTITGNGASHTYDYSSWTPYEQGVLESLTSLPTITHGTVNTMVVSVIPEPSTYGALFGLVALGFAAYRRRRRQVG